MDKHAQVNNNSLTCKQIVIFKNPLKKDLEHDWISSEIDKITASHCDLIKNNTSQLEEIHSAAVILQNSSPTQNT